MTDVNVPYKSKFDVEQEFRNNLSFFLLKRNANYKVKNEPINRKETAIPRGNERESEEKNVHLIDTNLRFSSMPVDGSRTHVLHEIKTARCCTGRNNKKTHRKTNNNTRIVREPSKNGT